MQRKKGSKGMGKTGKKTTSDALCGVVGLHFLIKYNLNDNV